MDVTVSEDLIKIGPPGRKLFATVEQAEQLIVKLEAAVKTAVTNRINAKIARANEIRDQIRGLGQELEKLTGKSLTFHEHAKLSHLSSDEARKRAQAAEAEQPLFRNHVQA
jgi:hypothetical protein